MEEFIRCKDMLSNHIALTSFNFDRKTYIQSDGSNTSLGYVVYQTDENGLNYIIALGSLSLKTRQTLYSSIDLQVLGMRFALSKTVFCTCLKVHLVTDCQGISEFVGQLIMDINNARLQKLLIELVEINYMIMHIHSNENTTAKARTDLLLSSVRHIIDKK